MRKGLVAILGILVLYFAAWNVRLSDRARRLEEQLASAGRRKPAAREEHPAVETTTLVPTPNRPAETAPPRKAETLPMPAPQPERPAGPRPGFLGVSGADDPGGGVRILAVIGGSVAERAGLRGDDVILEYNGDRVATLAALTARIREGGEGSPVSLRIRRGDTEFYQGVQLGARN